jgi:uncharacterized repeat protein (TIGR01451 family)
MVLSTVKHMIGVCESPKAKKPVLHTKSKKQSGVVVKTAIALMLAGITFLSGLFIFTSQTQETYCASVSTVNIPTVPNPVFEIKAHEPKKIRFINGSFEEPRITGSSFNGMFHMTKVPGWNTRPTYPNSVKPGQKPDYIEIQKPGFTSSETKFATKTPDGGSQYAELNCDVEGTLYQYCATEPGTKVYYEFYHSARQIVKNNGTNIINGPDVMNFYLSAPGAKGTDYVRRCSDSWPNWGHYTGSYVIPEGQNITEFAFESVSTAHGDHSMGNYLDGVRLYTQSYIDVTKVNNAKGGRASIGDVVTYTIFVENTGESDASHVKLIDVLPAGTELVPDSVKIDNMATSNYSYDETTRAFSINVGKDTTDSQFVLKGNGSFSTDCENSCLVSFDVEVNDQEIAENLKYESQVKVTYEDRYDTDCEQYTNYSNVSVFVLKVDGRPTKNAYVNEESVDNGEIEPVDVKIGDIITYTIESDSPQLPAFYPNPVFQTQAKPPTHVLFENGSFELPGVPSGTNATFDQDLVPGWASRPEKKIEIQKPTNNNQFATHTPDGGSHYAELNANQVGTLYQVCDTVPGDKIYYEFYHSARRAQDSKWVWHEGPDVMNFYLRPEGQTSGGLQRVCSDWWNVWGHYTGSYIVPEGQTRTEFSFESVSTAHGNQTMGNYLDGVRLYTQSHIELNIYNNAIDSKASINDIVTYTIEVTNIGESDASRVKLVDMLPVGTELVEGSVKIDGVKTNNYSYNAGTRKLGVNVGKDATASEGGFIKGDGSFSTDCKDTYTVTFNIMVNGQGLAENGLYENQVMTTYEDRYDPDRDQYTNYSNVDAFAFTMDDSYKLTDVIPDGLTILSASDNAEVNGQTVVWKLIELPEGHITVTVTVEVTGLPTTISGLYENTAYLSVKNQADLDSNTTYHKLNDPIIIDDVAKKAFINDDPSVKNGMENYPEKVEVGDEITYTITVDKRGFGSPGKNNVITITDIIPNGLTIISTDPQATIAEQMVIWELTDLTSGKHTVTVVVEVDDSDVSRNYENTAAIRIGDEPDMVTNPTYHKLVCGIPVSLSKFVTGKYPNRTREFIFEVYFTDADKNLLTGTSFPYVGGIIPGSGATEAPVNGTATDGYAKIVLKHGQMVTFEDVPSEAMVKVEEAEDHGYWPMYRVNGGSGTKDFQTDEINVGEDEQGLTIEFENTHFSPVPAGISGDALEPMMFLSILALFLASLLPIFLRLWFSLRRARLAGRTRS